MTLIILYVALVIVLLCHFIRSSVVAFLSSLSEMMPRSSLHVHLEVKYAFAVSILIYSYYAHAQVYHAY